MNEATPEVLRERIVRKNVESEAQISDEYLRVAEIMKREGRFDRELFDLLPLNKATCFRLPARRGARPDLVVVGAAWSPIELLVRQGWARDAAGAGELDSLVGSDLDDLGFAGARVGHGEGLPRPEHGRGAIRQV